MTDTLSAINQDLAKAPPAEPVVRPRDAASIILIDRSSRTPKVLMGRRHEGQVFMPGKFVFPGGRVERGDASMNIFGGLADHVERRLMARVVRPSFSRARAYALAAIRELAEETGYLYGSTEAGSPPVPHADWRIFARAGVFPTLGALAFVARAVTPPGRIRRYDTRFFAADAVHVAGRIDGIVGPDAELTELVWVTFRQARTLDLPAITRIVLEELEARIALGLHGDHAVPFFRTNRGRFVREEL
jgi:8-oxo-dGTP pyrophosphatase MutT (NUDIX family)